MVNGPPLPPPKLLTLPWNCLQISRTTPSNFSPLKNSTTTCTKCMSSPWDDVTWKQASYTSELYKLHKRAIQVTQASYTRYTSELYKLHKRAIQVTQARSELYKLHKRAIQVTQASYTSYTSELYKVHKRAIQGTQASYTRYTSELYKVHKRAIQGTQASYTRYTSELYKLHKRAIQGTQASYTSYTSELYKVHKRAKYYTRYTSVKRAIQGTQASYTRYTSELYKVHKREASSTRYTSAKRAIQGTKAWSELYKVHKQVIKVIQVDIYSRVVRCFTVKYSKSWPLKTTWKSWNVSLGLYLNEMGHGPLPEYKSGSYLNICIVSPDISHPPRVYVVPPSYLEGSVCCGDYLQPHW